ncbi:MAG: hypothetical protein ABFD61_05090 [Chloroherpetonaceae bacterium]
MKEIKREFKTQYNKDEMKNYLTVNIMTNSLFHQFIKEASWDGYTLHLKSRFGYGSIIFQDYLINIEIFLNAMGAIAGRQLESMLDQEFKKLETKE